MKRPSMPVYVEAWLTDPFTRSLPPEARAVYMDLLLFSWKEDGIEKSLIEDSTTLARICGVSRRLFGRIWGAVQPRFELDSRSKFRNPKVESERSRADKFREKQRNNAKRKEIESSLAEPGETGLAEPAGARSVSVCVSVEREETERVVSRGKAQRSTWQALALQIFGELNDARVAVIPGARRLEPTVGNLKHIAQRLADGETPESIRHVIAVCAAETRAGNPAKYFDQITPFRQDNFARIVARSAPALRSVQSDLMARINQREAEERGYASHEERMKAEG